jgi:hypothetical protein
LVFSLKNFTKAPRTYFFNELVLLLNSFIADIHEITIADFDAGQLVRTFSNFGQVNFLVQNLSIVF